ncbi:ABC transporter substrate-binding protein [Nocardioides sp. zg-1228]|uniref:ABC transporter substrate-binding protein n=1 Tax=Nocardioides sp. zg-1228 TaxID=2763008 RepID=UPI0016426491|nr:ABC transporter substrate-binding protein [Nocardioides sp. zg-1228]MBC2934823.1 ABC transporter substrate-binding protein [Nocardioides sp. zg-1228]QSF58386.1 ABC transporter substrate-binding protein [Nocardioides sp. zg-1228]
MSRHFRVAGPLAVALATSLVLGACGAGGRDDSDDGDGGGGGAAADPGVTDDTVTIGATFPLTGVAAPGYAEIPTGAKAYFDYVNEAGGVHGRTIEYIVKDDGYNPTNTSTVTNELVLQDEVFATVGSLGTPTQASVADYLNDEGVPQLMVSSGSLQWGDDVEARPMTFGWQPDYESEGKVIGQWVADNMPDARVGLFLQDDDLGEDAEKGVRRYIDDQIVAVERYTTGNTDVAPQITGLQAEDVDLVLAFNTPSYTALSQLVALKTGFTPKWFYANIGSDPALVGSLLERFSEGAVTGDSGALDGVMTTEYIPGVDSADDPWVQLWQEVWDEHGGKGELTNYRIYGMSQAYAFVQALDAAGEDLTRDGLVAAIEEGGSEWEGPQLAPFRYGADSHMGIAGMRLVELKAGVGEPVTDVLVTDIGDAEITTDDSGQADDSPPEGGVPTS